MKRVEHLLACLGEECGELQQQVGKCLRFGYEEENRKHGGVNIENLRLEYYDVIAMYEMLMLEVGLSFEPNERLVKAKQDKVEKFFIDETYNK